MTKQTPKTTPAWKLLPPAVASSLQANLFFRRSHAAGPPPTARQATVQKHVDEWKAADPFYAALATLRQREQQTTAELVEAEKRLVEARENLVVMLTTTCEDSGPAEKLVVETEANLAALKARVDVIRHELPQAYRLAFQTYALLTSSVAEQEMHDAKPVLADVVAEIETTIGPLLDRLFAARRSYDESGRNFPEATSVLGPPPPSVTPEKQQATNGPLPIVVDNRLKPEHRQPIRGPEQPVAHDLAVPMGPRPWFDSGTP
jgi:hypothetical protein